MTKEMGVPVVEGGDNEAAPSNLSRGRRTKLISGVVMRANDSDTSDLDMRGEGVVLAPSNARDGMDTGVGRDVRMIPVVDDGPKSSLVVVDGLRPRQVLAATLLVQGRRGKDVAATLGVSAETVSRWRQLPAFEALMHRMLQETIDTTKLGIVALCAESIEHLRGLIRSFSDDTALKAITLVLGKVAPVLGVVGAELRRPSDSQTE